ncbi:LysR family transcriptional regulator [Bacillus sp. NP157]|nr:LysR family transcriptional regulator [Bacillus sp. NP157]
MFRLSDLTLFTRVAVLGSFTATANEADLEPAQVSAAVRRLEQELGVALLVRHGRSVRLTEEGERYLPHAGDILLRLRESMDLLIADDERPVQATLRIAVPTDLGRNLLMAWLAAFRNAYPGIQLQVAVSDEDVDLFNDPFDAAIRYGVPSDGNHVSLALARHNRRALVASAEYLAVHGRPESPADLVHHACLVDVAGGRIRNRWQFPGAEPRFVDVAAHRSSNDAELVRHWAIAGDGIAYKSWLDVSCDVEAGRLIVLMPDVPGDPAPLNLACATRRQFLPAVRRLHAWIAEAAVAHLSSHPVPMPAVYP